MTDSSTYNVDHIVVGRSARMRAVFDFVRVIADSDSSVLVTGETGTGKELIANLVHHSSARRHRPQDDFFAPSALRSASTSAECFSGSTLS